MIIYNWSVLSLEVVPQLNNLSNVVNKINYRVTGLEDSYLGELNSHVKINLNENNSFIPFDNLTNEQVVNWLHETLGSAGVSAHENAIRLQIENQKNPPSVVKAPPWVI